MCGQYQGTASNRYSTPYDLPKKNSNQSAPGSWTISTVSFTIKVRLTLPLMLRCCHGTPGKKDSTPYDLPNKHFKPKSPGYWTISIIFV